ncbi:hypothetical protein AOQ84DRAFT_415577 [Glonium stellatum]|uniref:Uncharacterized protein n=1 Tax=Glonium stellatum TaxID=574774 RepID=A0A8E2ETR1_9PEZI|nr:hypothetical protein AOQ84DRAFT_415577 [Glonium stellatum]
MGDIHNANDFKEWTADFVERFPRYNISFSDSPFKRQLKDVGRLTALSPDGSIAVIATLKKIKVYGLERAVPHPISFQLRLSKSDEIRACDISVSFLAIATFEKLLVYAFGGDFSLNSNPLLDIDISKGDHWAPTCLTLFENQQSLSQPSSSSWAWVAVGGGRGVKLFLLRKHMTWSLQIDKPVLWSGIESVKMLSASPNLSQDPYASILAGVCETTLLFWDLRQRMLNDQNPLRATAVIPVPCYSTFISPIVSSLAKQKEAEVHWHEIEALSGDVVTGIAYSGLPVIVAIEANKLKLVQLQGRAGGLISVEHPIEMPLRPSVRPDGPSGISIRLVTKTNKLTIIVLDYKGTVTVVEARIPNMPGPNDSPPQLPALLDGTIRAELHGTSSRNMSLPESTITIASSSSSV